MLKRISIVPFEVAIAFYALFSGVASIAHFGVIDPLAALLPHWEALFLNIATLISGVFMVAGVSSGISRIEQAGLFFLDGILISRFLLYGHYLHYGPNFFVTGLFTLALLAASVARSITISKKHIIVKVDNEKLIDELGD